MRLELLDDRRPALAAGMLAGIETYPAQGFAFFEQPAGRIDERHLITGHGQGSAVPVADMLGGSGLIIGNYRQPRGHGFEHHIAKGFGQAGEQEQVAAGIVLGQCFTPLGATEHRIWQLLFESCTLRAVANHDQAQPRVWISLLQGVQAWP
ncbi:hypothetical protein D3C81_1196720 [compost metagenome]